MSKYPLEPCRQLEKCPNCFARVDKKFCRILTNTEFLKRKCPFYKTVEQNEEEKTKYPYNSLYGKEI